MSTLGFIGSVSAGVSKNVQFEVLGSFDEPNLGQIQAWQQRRQHKPEVASPRRSVLPQQHSLKPPKIASPERILGIPVRGTDESVFVHHYPEIPAWAEAVPNPEANEIEKLCDAETKYFTGSHYDLAEEALNHAIELNEPHFNGAMYDYLTDELIRIYGIQKRTSEAERLYETKSKRLGLWNDHLFQRRLTYFFIKNKKYAEARAILRHSVPRMTAPAPGGWCGTPYIEYTQEQGRYKMCVDNTSDMTEEQLDRVEEGLKTRFVEVSKNAT